jgi:hypothetical protein
MLDRGVFARHQSGIQLLPAFKDVAGDVGGAERGGMGTQPDKRIGGIEAQLGHHQAGRLTDLGPAPGVRLHPRADLGRGSRLLVYHVQHRQLSQFGGLRHRGYLLGSELSGPGLKHAEGADTVPGHYDRNAVLQQLSDIGVDRTLLPVLPEENTARI